MCESCSVVSNFLQPKDYSDWVTTSLVKGRIIHGILQARILKWVASLSLLQGTFPSQVSHIAGGFYTS